MGIPEMAEKIEENLLAFHIIVFELEVAISHNL